MAQPDHASVVVIVCILLCLRILLFFLRRWSQTCEDFEALCSDGEDLLCPNGQASEDFEALRSDGQGQASEKSRSDLELDRVRRFFDSHAARAFFGPRAIYGDARTHGDDRTNYVNDIEILSCLDFEGAGFGNLVGDLKKKID